MNKLTIVGQRVILKPLRLFDLYYVIKWLRDPSLNKYTNRPHSGKSILSHLRCSAYFCIWIKDAPVPIGVISFHIHESNIATTGIVIGDKSFWGKGIAPEAKKLLLRHLFEKVGVEKVIAIIDATNQRSISYNLKCGYQIVEEKSGKSKLQITRESWRGDS